jgi:hypothetical protein
MASTFSPTLRLELIGDGDQSGIWGQTTNNNLGALIEQAVTGVITISMTDANYTLSNFNGVVDEARNQVIVLTGTLSVQRNLIAPLVEKTYAIKNTTTGGFGVQVIGASGTGVVIPNGAVTFVYCDGTNFYALVTGSAGNFSVAGNLSAAGNLAVTGTTTLTGALAVTGATTFTGIPSGPTAAPGTSTTQLATTAFVQGVAGALGTMSTQNANAVAITGGTITGITDLAVADGGTGSSTLAANNVLLGNGTSALQAVAPSTSGNVLTSNGTTWTSVAPPPIGARGQVFTSNGTFTIPTGITAIKVTVLGGGGGGAGEGFYPGAGSAGGTSSITSGTQSITSTTCTGGGGGNANGQTGSFYYGGGGSASGGTLNYSSVAGNIIQKSLLWNFSIGGNSPSNTDQVYYGGGGGANAITYFTGLTSGNTLSVTVGAGGGGGAAGGGCYCSTVRTGQSGGAGVVIVEW